jgi:CRP-like cAMP-binding protein
MARDRRRPRRANLSELIADKDYAQAISVLREQVRVHEQLSQRPPSIQRRLQLADLLLLSGRREEALPILDALAVELMKDGFAAKAVAILKRIDRLDPGRADVETRLAQLANRPVRAAAPPAVTELPATLPELPAALPETPATESQPATIGPEEHPPVGPAKEAPVEPVSTAPEVQTAAETVEAEAATPAPAVAEAPEAAPTREGTGFTSMLKRLFTMLPRKPEEQVKPPAAPGDAAPGIAEAKALTEPAEPTTMEEAAAEREPEPAPEATPETKTETVAASDTTGPREATAKLEPSAEVALPDAASPEVVEKLGGVFKKFLAALPGASEDDDLDSEVAAREFVDALAASGLDQDDDDGEFIAAFIDDDGEAAPPVEPIVEAAPDDLPEVFLEADPDTAPIARPKPAAWAPSASGTPITEADFRDQVFDLLEQVLRQPDEPTTGPLPPPAENTEPLAASYRDTLLLHPLFSDLSPSEMLAMLRALSLVFMAPGDIIVTEGEPGASLFLIISGDVLLFVRNPEGRNVEVGRLSEGAFFGEMSVLSGKPRNATITAGSRVEMLELPKALLDGIAQAHPRVRDIVDALYLERASSAEVAAVRSVATGDTDDARERAREVLRTYFGGRRFEPRMQLKLATVLLKAGKQDEAVPVLVTLANELLREGDAAKAIAILKKVEVIRTRSLEVMNLAPLVREDADDGPPSAPRRTPPEPDAAGARTEAFFAQWLTDTARRANTNASPIAARRIPGYGPELLANPLFEGFTEEELLAFIQGLRLLAFEPGDIMLTEGESGESVFILAGGSVKVSVRDPSGRSISLCELQEGAFFGEISALSGRLRSATVTAASHCELLELDRAALDTIAISHPRIRQVLEEAYIERAASPEAARIRTTGRVQPEL